MAAAKRRKPKSAAAERARQQRLARQRQREREERRARKARSERAARGWETRRARERERERKRAEAAAKRKRSRASKKAAAKRAPVEPSAEPGPDWGTWVPRGGGGGDMVFPEPPHVSQPGRGPKRLLRALVGRAGLERTAQRFGVTPRTLARWLAAGVKIPAARQDQIRAAAARSDRTLLAMATRKAKRALIERAKVARWADLHGIEQPYYDEDEHVVLGMGADGVLYQMQTLISEDGRQYDQWARRSALEGYVEGEPVDSPANLNFAYQAKLGRSGSQIQIFFPIGHGRAA